MEDNNQTETEHDFLLMEEPELKGNIEFCSIVEETQPVELNHSIDQSKQKRYPKRFFYEDDYEIFYSNRKNRIMIKNYKVSKYHNIKLSSFILRYHNGLNQDNILEIRTCKMIIQYFEFHMKNGNFLCDFFINEDDSRLWIVIKTAWNEYFYDITTHFLVLCCNEGEYEWYSLLNCDYIDDLIDYEVASNKKNYELLISWIHCCLKHMFLISRDTTN